MDPALRDAVLGAGNITAPASPLGASNGAELGALYSSTFQLPQSSGAASAGANIADQQVAAQKAAAAAAKAKEIDLADPSKYRKVKKADGGFDFYSPDGKQIDIATLTKLTQTKAADWLDDSENPIDIQYLEDHKNLNEYIAAKLGGDKEKASQFEEARAELADYQGQGGADRLISDFKKHYQRFYVPRSQDQSAWGQRPGGTFVPRSADPLDLGGGIGG